jgi:hypothetical protein
MRRHALEWIRDLLATEARSPKRSIVDFEVERELLVHSKFQAGQVYRLEVGLWEAAGLARVQGRRIEFPADTDPWEEPPPPRPPRPDEALDPQLLRELRAATRGRAREGELRCGTWAHQEDAGRRDLTWVWIERRAPDARIMVEVDPQTGVRLGAFRPYRARGSCRSGAISRARAVQEARARLNLPAEAAQIYTRLCKRPRSRVWNVRWEVSAGPWRGVVRAELNARTAEVIESELRLQPRRTSRALPASERAAAEQEIRRQVRVLVGGAAEIGPLVPGLSESGEHPCWLSVVRDAEGTRRVTYRGGKVSLGPTRRAS